MSESVQHRSDLVHNVLAATLCIFVLVAVNSTLFNQQPNLALFGMLGMTLVFLSRPMFKRWQDSKFLRVFDWILIAGTVVTFGYIFVQSESCSNAFGLKASCSEIAPETNKHSTT